MSEAAVAYSPSYRRSAGRRSVNMRTPSTPQRVASGGVRSGSALSMPRPPSGESLTPMPDYMRPVTRSAQRRFKKLHEDHMMGQLMQKRAQKKDQNQKTREEARKVARKIPMEVLAKDWMSATNATVETRAYLVDKVLPTIVLGMEKLLLEVDRKDLAETETPDANFNPINYLAQYLMRNNPRYSNFSEASPYIRGLREITEELKQQLFDIEENRLARIKADAKRKREEREHEENLRQMEVERRTEALERQFSEWNVGLYYNGRVELALVQNALRSFVEVTEHYPDELREAAKFSQDLEPTDDSGKTLALREFISYLNDFIEDMPSEVFDQFLIHMSRCALSYRSQAEQEQRKVLLTQLFVSCDHTGVGLLDRHRILSLFEMFYDKLKERAEIRNPRRWPVVQLHEEDDSLSDSDEEQDPKFFDNNKDVTEETKAAEKKQHDPQEEKTAEKAEPEEKKESTVEPGEEQQLDREEGKTEAEKTEEKEGEVGGEGEKEEEKEGETGKEEEQKEEGEGKAKEEEESEQEASSGDQKKQDEEKDKGVEKDQEENNKSGEKQEAAGDGDGEKQEAAGDGEKDEGKKTPVEGKEEKEQEEEQSKAKEKDAEAGEEKKDGEKDAEKEEEKEEEKAEEPKKEDREEVPTDKEKKTSQEGEKDEDEAEEKAAAAAPAAAADAAAADAAAADDEDAEEGELSDQRPPMTQQSKVSFAEGTHFQRENTLLTSQGSRSQSQASAFDENCLNMSQFVQVTETFLGDIPDMDTFKRLSIYIREGYVETEEERMERLIKARQEAMVAKRKALLNSLFEMWDNDGSGFLDMDEVETVMKKYKEGLENEAINKGKKERKKQHRHRDNRLSKREFRDFVHMCAAHMSGDDCLDNFAEFLLNSVERTYTERVRGEARKKWLQQIVRAAETSGARMEPVYKTVFQTLYKDAEAHGGGKIISANISLLERNEVAPSRGLFLLRYVATTLDDAPFLLNHALFADMKGVSFAAVEGGKPIHVPRVNNHGNIHFWNPDRDSELAKMAEMGADNDGSFIVVPLKDKRKRVFGLLGVDTIKDIQGRAIFITHEIQFFQGIAKAFSIAYHHVDVRQKTMRISESAISWIHRRSPHVHEIAVYMVEPHVKTQDYLLRKMMTTDHKGNAMQMKDPPKLERKDNLFRDYLFKCVDNSESITADAYGQRHLAIPLRDDEGRAIVVIDISIGELKSLPKLENREVMRILRLLQMAYKELTKEEKDAEEGGEQEESAVDTIQKSVLLEGETLGEEQSVEILFDRLMLMELRENVAKLDAQAYAELKSYKEPPAIVHLILKAVLGVFYPEKAEAGEFDNWDHCKKYMNPALSQRIIAYDPTGDDGLTAPVDLINSYLEEVPHGEVSKHGSIPAQFLYNWVFVCVSLVDHSRKMKANKQENVVEEEKEEEKKEPGAEEPGAEEPGAEEEELTAQQMEQDEAPNDNTAQSQQPTATEQEMNQETQPAEQSQVQ